MAQSLLSVLKSMHEKILALNLGIKKLQEKNESLEEEIKELRLTVRELERQRDIALQENEFLTVSYRLADNPDKLMESRRLIARWIRNIERCIEMLKE